MKKVKIRRIHQFSAVSTIAAFYILLHILNIGCPIKFMTGIPCAGCGMTRAWLSVMKLKFADAFSYHPLFWLVPFGGIFLMNRKRIPPKAACVITGSLVVLFITVYIIRMINPEDTVVKINFYESAIWHTLEKVREIL